MEVPSVFPVVTASRACIQAFEVLIAALEHPNQQSNRNLDLTTIEAQRDRFKVWATSLGGLQHGRASLDFRLMDAPLLQNMVLKFLTDLEQIVRESTEVVQGKRLPKEDILVDTLGHPTAYEDDSSGSSTCSERLTDDLPQTELGQNSDEIDDIIKSLVKISFRIRGIGSRDSKMGHKATTYKLLIQNEELRTIDIFSVYSVFDRRHVEDWVLQLRKSAEETVSTAGAAVLTVPDEIDDEEGNSSDEASIFGDDDLRLIDRWTKATTARRRVLAYWQRHARKLASRDPEPLGQEIRIFEHASSILEATQPTLDPHTVSPIPAPESLAASSSQGITLLSATEATRVPILMDVTDTSSITSYSTYLSEEGEFTDLPSPPVLVHGQSEFTCPYCHVLCPKRDAKGRHWREHVMHDLQPYQCTYPYCEDADVMFPSKKSWIEHESQSHRRVWRCYEHPDLFTTKEELARHFELSHTTLGNLQVQEILKQAYTCTQDKRTQCPFCTSCGPYEENLASHMASHMERLALFAIPVSPHVDDHDGHDDLSSRSGSGVAHGGGSATSLNSVNLSFSDAGSMSLPAPETEVTGHHNIKTLELYDETKPDVHSEAMKWLAPEDYMLQCDFHLEKRHPGTLKWFFESEDYGASVSRKGQLLYLSGLPGAGKSVLAAAIIDDLRGRFESLGCSVAYYFCPSQRQNRTTESLLRSLIRQIVKGLPSLPRLIQSFHQKYLRDGKLPSLLGLLDALMEAATKVSRLFIIIDGFDILRSDQSPKLLESLIQLSRESGTTVFIASRSIAYVNQHFGRWRNVEVIAAKVDVLNYARAAILHMAPLLSRESVELQMAELKAVNFSNEVFLFATAYVQSMTAEVQPERRQRSLIDSFYEAEMKRNQMSSGFGAAKKVLTWVASSQTPLTLQDMRMILRLEADLRWLREDNEFLSNSASVIDSNQLYNMEKLLFWCSGLVVLDDYGFLRLFHHTANEYFTRTQSTWFPWAAEDQTCLCCEYLIRITEVTKDTERGFENCVADYPFFSYAAFAWGRYAFHIFDQEIDALRLREKRSYKVVKSLLSESRRVRSIVEALRQNVHSYQDRIPIQRIPQSWTSLHLATYFGLTEIIKDLLSESWNVLKWTLSEGDSLVALAAECGHRPTLNFLLESWNWELHALDDVLLGAARGGFQDIAEMALDRGADPSKPAPLCAASQYGHDHIVDLLLDMASKLVEPAHEESMCLAIRNGHSNIVRLFFDRGAAVYANFEKLLRETILAKSKTIAQFLLENEPWLANAKLDGGMKPLFFAIEQDDIAMVELLLEHGADPLEENRDGLTADDVAYNGGQYDMQNVVLAWRKGRGCRPDDTTEG